MGWRSGRAESWRLRLRRFSRRSLRGRSASFGLSVVLMGIRIARASFWVISGSTPLPPEWFKVRLLKDLGLDLVWNV
jgi:hypothetical protein